LFDLVVGLEFGKGGCAVFFRVFDYFAKRPNHHVDRINAADDGYQTSQYGEAYDFIAELTGTAGHPVLKQLDMFRRLSLNIDGVDNAFQLSHLNKDIKCGVSQARNGDDVSRQQKIDDALFLPW